MTQSEVRPVTILNPPRQKSAATPVRQISVVIITQDEEERTIRAIRSCHAFADEIVIVDGGSRDNTVERAQAEGCRVYVNPWPGYAKQRNFGAEKAIHEWVFFIDSDEVVGDDLAAALNLWKRQPDLEAMVFAVDRVTDFLGTWLTHGIDDQIRLYNKNFFAIKDVLVHERPDIGNAKVIRLPGTLWHYGFRDMDDQVVRFNRYTTLEAQRDYLAGQRFNLLRLILKPHARFIQRYFLRGFFKRGVPGFTYAVFWGYYDFLKEVKLYEIGQRSQSN
jgi:glycosyltransferase involved in cell wall biosynthesis